ncbi:MAG: cytochrome c-type biogenesis protein CcmH [Alcanivorax borkumensis]|jgi:cytochrome c-type biogenesis protein CcmH|uniref:tetratricopeptide repeat protein n=1 Tax=Alcanivorax borkumensis TaxID=59754 RepID=UPI003EED462E
MMLWVMSLVLLLILATMLWLMWRSEARKAGKNMSGALGIPLVMVILAGAGYGLIGLNEHTGTWLTHKQEYGDVAQQIIAGQPPEKAASEVPAGALVRVLQSELSQTPSAVGWYALGALYDQLGAPVQTEEAARKALQLNPENAAMHLLLARALIEKNEARLTDPALDEIRWVLDREPNHDGAWMLLAMSADRAGRYALAEQAWASLLSRHSQGETADLLQRGLNRAREQKQREGLFANLSATVHGENLPAGGTLFVFLREAGSAGQPLAAQRKVVPHFPINIELTAANWLQSYPDEQADLVIGARYTPAPGASVDQAAITAVPTPLKLPQRQPAVLNLSRQ